MVYTHPEEIEQAGAVLMEVLETLTDQFFAGKDAEEAQRQTFLKIFPTLFSPPLLAQYHALASDFFAWLNNVSAHLSGA